jgi:hypothetical protein
MKLIAAGLSHKTAPVELREQLAVKQSEIVDLAFVLKCFGHLDEVVLLSTCNRVEIYGTTRQATGHIKSLLQLHLIGPWPRRLCAIRRPLPATGLSIAVLPPSNRGRRENWGPLPKPFGFALTLHRNDEQ